jgi:hypothetical protein
MKNREVAAPGVRFRERPDLVPQVIVYRQREDLGFVAHPSQQITDVPRAVADGVSRMGGRHPLVDSHRAFFSITMPVVDPGAAGSA